MPRSNATRRAMFAGASVVFVAAADGACSQAVYGAPGEPYPFSDGGAHDAADVPAARDTGLPPDANPLTCFVNAGEALRGLPPKANRDVCTPQDLVDVEAACLRDAHSSKACTDWTSAHPNCGRCIFGALPGESPDAVPLGALTPMDSQTLVASLGSCAAVVLGRPDCALPIARANLCRSGGCATCTGPAKATCSSYADSQGCETVLTVECRKILRDSFAVWGSICQGASAASTFTKVAEYLCGAPYLDGGNDASRD